MDRKCPKCGRKLGKHEILMTLSHDSRSTGEFCIRCLEDFKKQLSKKK